MGLARSHQSHWSYPSHLLPLALCLALASPIAAVETNGLPSLFTWSGSLPRFTATYAPRPLAWEALATPTGVRAVFPHPARSETIYALTAAGGLMRSDDDAATWRHLPLAGLDAAAAITSLAFRPGEPETFCLGTRAHGVWISRDGGNRAQQIGSKAAGMASDAVASLVYAPGDPFLRTLLVAHGKDAPGISRGDTGEGTWTVVARDHVVYRIIPGDPETHDLYLFAAETAAPDTVGVYYTAVLEVFWQRLISDTLPTDAVWLDARRAMCVTTLDKGITRAAGNSGTVESLGGEDLEWFSAATTWGAHADQELLCLYQPSKRGLLTTTNDLTTALELSRGLYHGTFVSEGSHIRPNAGGTRFYGAINGALWVGRVDGPLRVDTIAVTPAAVTIAASALDESRWRSYDEDVHDFVIARRAAPLSAELAGTLRELNGAIPNGAVTLQARVTSPAGTGTVVTADLSRFGLSADAPLAPASNGLYRAAFDVTREGIARHKNEWRPAWPGPIPITVTARVPDALPAGGVGLFSLYVRPETFTFWSEGKGLMQRAASGLVTFDCVRDPRRAASGQFFLRLDAGPGPWQISLGHSRMHQNIGNFYAMTFQIRSIGPADEDLQVHLADNPTYSYPTITPGVSLVAGGHVAGGAIVPDAWRQVTVPVADLLRGAEGFLPEFFGWVVFSGDSATRRTYLVDDIRFIVLRKELDQEVRNAR